MKKLMIVAALAAMTGAALADAQVYDMKLKLKTTTCKEAKVSEAIEKLGWFNVKKGDKVAFRGSATRKLAGVIWGCNCEAISRPSWRVENQSVQRNPKGVGGYAFWDQTSAPYKIFQIPYTTFNWAVLNRDGKTMKNVEGTWILGDSAAGEAFYFMGAGFGTCTLNATNGKDCESYIKSITGNFAGFAEYAYSSSDGCFFCGETYQYCLVAPFCVCEASRDTTGLTVAYGSWQLKYNSKESKALRSKSFITKVRNFTGKKAANLGLAIEAGYFATLEAWGKVPVPTAVPDTDSAAATTSYFDVTSAELATKGKYYTHAKTRETSWKNATVTPADPGSYVDEKDVVIPAVAKALVISLGHVETTAWEGDSEGGDDWGDDEGDDWGDDEGDDEWDF